MSNNPLKTKRWKEKTNFVPGIVPSVTVVPKTRYQVLNGQVFYLQVYGNTGETARGQMTLAELEQQFGEPVTKEGWYDHAGKYLGDDPGLE